MVEQTPCGSDVDKTSGSEEQETDLIDLGGYDSEVKNDLLLDDKAPGMYCPECVAFSSNPKKYSKVSKEQAVFVFGVLGPMDVKCKQCDESVRYQDVC